jgi:hypothetical protein
MIFDSGPWKSDLLATATWLDKVRINQRNYERNLFRVEKEVFNGFYAVRKLLDTFKVTDKTKAKTFNLKWSRQIRTVDYQNWHHLEKNFDLKATHKETRNIRFLCDQFIHSYVFIPRLGTSGRLSGFYISSDRMRHEKLYFISARQVLSVFRTVGRDDPTQAYGQRDPVTGQFNFVVK